MVTEKAASKRPRLHSVRFGPDYMPPPAEPLPPSAELSTAELATLLGVSQRTVNRRLKDGAYPFARRAGGQTIVYRAEVERWLSHGSTDQPDAELLAEAVRLWREANEQMARALEALLALRGRKRE